VRNLLKMYGAYLPEVFLVGGLLLAIGPILYLASREYKSRAYALSHYEKHCTASGGTFVWNSRHYECLPRQVAR
jgi:hypothetical protein